MKRVVAEKYRDIDFSRGKRGPVIKPEPGKAKISIRLDNVVLEHFRGLVHGVPLLTPCGKSSGKRSRRIGPRGELRPRETGRALQGDVELLDPDGAHFAERRFIGMKRMALAKKNSSSSTPSRAERVLRQPRSSYVLCVRNRGYPASLELRKVYRQIADAWAHRHDLIRIVDESGEDYLYP